MSEIMFKSKTVFFLDGIDNSFFTIHEGKITRAYLWVGNTSKGAYTDVDKEKAVELFKELTGKTVEELHTLWEERFSEASLTVNKTKEANTQLIQEFLVTAFKQGIANAVAKGKPRLFLNSSQKEELRIWNGEVYIPQPFDNPDELKKAITALGYRVGNDYLNRHGCCITVHW